MLRMSLKIALKINSEIKIFWICIKTVLCPIAFGTQAKTSSF